MAKQSKPSRQNIYQVLKNDHREVKELISELLKGRKRDEEMFKNLKAQLQAHSEIEDDILYNRIIDEVPEKSDIFEAKEEHHLVDHLLSELDEDIGDDEWIGKLRVLQENVETHIREEEGKLFREARKIIEREEALEIGERMVQRKEEWMEKAGMGPSSRESQESAY